MEFASPISLILHIAAICIQPITRLFSFQFLTSLNKTHLFIAFWGVHFDLSTTQRKYFAKTIKSNGLWNTNCTLANLLICSVEFA